MNRILPRVLAGALLLASVGCESLTTSDLRDTNLTRSELRALAYGVSVLGTDQAEEVAWDDASLSTATVSGPSLSVSGGGGGRGVAGLGIWGRFRPGVHGTTTTTVDRTVPCPQGGTNRSVTTVTSVVDTVARTGKVTTESTDTPDQCAFTVDSLNATLRAIANPSTVITITGAPNLVTRFTSSYAWVARIDSTPGGRVSREPTTGTQTGSFTYTTSDNRSGSCTVDLSTEFDPENRTQSVTGTFCGQTINLTATLPARGERGGRGGHRGGHR